eukprot:1581090-Ditylum_brightwellii.AAC.1
MIAVMKTIKDIIPVQFQDCNFLGEEDNFKCCIRKTRIEDVCGAAFPEEGNGNNVIGDNNADGTIA